MTAPGQHLEFGASKNFKNKMKAIDGLEDQVKGRLRDWPHAGAVICGQVREVRMTLEARVFGVVYLRRGQQVRLLDIFGLPEDERELEDYRRLVKGLFCGGKP